MVSHFDADLWNERKLEIIVQGNLAKFIQNPDLKDFLVATGNKKLGEAGPYDKIRGIGLDERVSRRNLSCKLES